MGDCHRWDRKEAQHASENRAVLPDDKLYTQSRVVGKRYEYLVDGMWLSRQAVSQRRKRKQKT